MKTCSKCGVRKPVSKFYTRGSVCKECKKLAEKLRRRNPETRERMRIYEHERYKGQKRRQQALQYQVRGRLNNPGRAAAYSAIRTALLNGSLVKLPCEVCGDTNVQAHHDDYSKPLDVRWLCFKHHREFAHNQIVGQIT